MLSFSKSVLKNTVKGVSGFVSAIIERVQKFIEFIAKHFVLIIIILVLAIIGLSILMFKVSVKNLNKCIEAGKNNLTNNTSEISILAYPNDNSFFEVQENSYDHEQDGGKMNALSKMMDGTSIKKNNSTPLIIEITGSWIPWFGDLIEKDDKGNITNSFQRDVATPNKTELCRFRKQTLDKEYNGVLQAREYYYLENFYKSVNFERNTDNTAIIPDTKILDPVLQEPCWVEGGTGLYLGFYGTDGNGFPKHFHHLQANEMICDPNNFLRNYNYATQSTEKFKKITNFDFSYNNFYTGDAYKSIKNMSYGDYIYQNFSLNYAKARQEAYDTCKGKMTETGTIDACETEFKEQFDKELNESVKKILDGKGDISTTLQMISCTTAKNMMSKIRSSFPKFYANTAEVETKVKTLLKDNYTENDKISTSGEIDLNKVKCAIKEEIIQELRENTEKLSSATEENAVDNRNCKTRLVSDCIKNIIETEKNTFFETKKDYFLSYKDGYIVYNIRKHEKAMIYNGIREYPQIIAKAQQAFKDACYYPNKLGNNKGYNIIEAAKYRFREYYDENRIMADYENNTNYKDKEVGKILILDKYYSDNQGGYSLDFKSGFIVDTTSEKISISNKFRDIEKFLLGSSKPHEEDDRMDGFIYKVYKNILDSGFETIAKAALALFVAIKGLYVILGFVEMKRKDFMLFCVRVAFLFSIVDSNGWAFYNKTFINYFVNAVIGFVDLMANIFNDIYSLILPSSVVNNSLRIFEKTSTTANTYEIWRYLSVFDNIFDFLKDPTLHKRILSLIFIKGNPAIGIIMFLLSYYMIYKFVKAIITSLVPLIIIVAQIAILLPLAPIFLVFMFFSRTESYFKNWLKNMVSRSFELIVFFFILFTTTGLISGKMQEFFSYKVCYRYIYSAKNDDSAFKKESDLISMNKSKANWILEAVQNVTRFVFKTLFGKMVVPIPEGLSDISLLGIFLNFIILFFLIFMYATINSSITQLLSKVFSFKDPQDKNDKGKFENASSGLIKSKHNDLTPDVFRRLANMGGKGIIEGGSSIFSTDKNGKHIKRISTNQKFLKNIGGVFKIGKDMVSKTANAIDTISGGRITFGQQRRLDRLNNTRFGKSLNTAKRQTKKFGESFEKAVTIGNFKEFKKDMFNNKIERLNNKIQSEINKLAKTRDKLLKKGNHEYDGTIENISNRIKFVSTLTAVSKNLGEREDIKNARKNGIVNQIIKNGNRDLATIRKTIATVTRINRQEINFAKTELNIRKYNNNKYDNKYNRIQKNLESENPIVRMFGKLQKEANKKLFVIKDKRISDKISIDTGLTKRFIKQIDEQIQESNKLILNKKLEGNKEFEKFITKMNEMNEKFLNRDTERFIKGITTANARLLKNKFINKNTKSRIEDRIDIYTKLQENALNLIKNNKTLDLTATNALLKTFERVDKIDIKGISLSKLIQENAFNNISRTKNTRKNIIRIAEQQLASDIIKGNNANNEIVDKKVVDRFTYITKKVDDLLYTRNSDKFKEISAIQTALTIDRNYSIELDKLNESLKRDNIPQIEKTKIERRIEEIQEIRKNSAIEIAIASDKQINELTDRLNRKDITKEEKSQIEKDIIRIKSDLKIKNSKPIDKTFEKQEILLSKLEEYKTDENASYIDKEIEKTNNRLNIIKALREKESPEVKQNIYQKLLKPLEAQTTETEIMLGIEPQTAKLVKSKVIKEQIKTLEKELKIADGTRKAEISKEIDLLRVKDIDGLSKFYDSKAKFTERRAVAQIEYLDTVKEAKGNKNKLQLAEKLLSSREELITAQEKIELVRNGDTKILKAKLLEEQQLETNEIERKNITRKIEALENKDGKELLKSEFETKERVAVQKIEVYKSQQNQQLMKEDRIETIKTRLDNELETLNSELETLKEHKTTLEIRKDNVQEKDVKQIESQIKEIESKINKIETRQIEIKQELNMSKEQLQQHFETKERVAVQKIETYKEREQYNNRIEDLKQESKREDIKPEVKKEIETQIKQIETTRDNLFESRKQVIDSQQNQQLMKEDRIETIKTRLDSELKTLNSELEKLKEQKNISQEDKLETRSKIEARKVEVQKDQEALTKQETIKTRLDTESKTLNNELETLEKNKNDLKTLKEQEIRKDNVQEKDVKQIESQIKEIESKINKIETRQIEIKQELNMSKEQLQQHFETKERVAVQKIESIDIENLVHNLPEKESSSAKTILEGKIKAINQEILEIESKPEQILEKEQIISKLKKEVLQTVQQTISKENQYNIEDTFSIEQFAPGTKSEAFTIQLDENAFIISTNSRSFNIVVSDNLYPCQVTKEGTINIDPLEEQIKESFTVLKKANDFNIKMLEYQLSKSQESGDSQIKQNNLKQKLDKAKQKDKQYKKQLERKAGEKK